MSNRIQMSSALKMASGFLASFCFAAAALADPADVVGVEWSWQSDTALTVQATISHNDTGWDHYADAFHVETQDGQLLKTRVLAHPHVNEQPFTRSLGAIEIPQGTCVLVVWAKDNLGSERGQQITIDICNDELSND